MRIDELTKKETKKFSIISIIVVVFYTIYNFQGSASYFRAHIYHSFRLLRVQAYSYYYQWSMAFLLLGIIPMLIVKFVFREKLEDYGLKFKKPLISILIALLGILFVTPFTYFGAKNRDFISLYPLVKNSFGSVENFVKAEFFYFLYYIGYEFFFRGFLFMGIRKHIGDWEAIGVSLMATVLLHVDRPEGEMAMAILAGIVFPIIVRKMKTLWPVILIHAYTGISLDYWIILNHGGF